MAEVRTTFVGTVPLTDATGALQTREAVMRGELDQNDPTHAPRVLALYEAAMGVYVGAHALAPIDLARRIAEELSRG